MINIQIINNSPFKLPEYKTIGSSGMDIQANILGEDINKYNDAICRKDLFTFIDGNDYIIIKPNGRIMIPTGIYVAIPMGREIQIRPRSGMAYKHGITVLNAPGTIDADYRGEICVILHNTNPIESIAIKHGERIAQMVVCNVEESKFIEVTELSSTDRGSKGFGSTGKGGNDGN